MKNNDTRFFGHPTSLATLFATEMWERFSYYGMRSFLTLFLMATLAMGGFGMDKLEAFTIYGIFTGMVYITPMLGGILADKLLGQRKTILIGGITKAIGQFTLAYSASINPEIVELRQTLFFIGLTILIIGNGFFKPNISTMVGDLYDNNDPRKDGGFTIFYMGINLGAFLAPLIAGNLAESVAWQYGFLTAGIGMVLGTIWFYARSSAFGHIGMPPKSDINKTSFITKDWLNILSYVGGIVIISNAFIFGWRALSSNLQTAIIWTSAIAGIIYIAISIIKNTETKTEWSRIGVIFILAFFNIFFWSGFEQAGTTFNVFALNNTDRTFSVSHIWQFIIGLSFVLISIGFWMKKKGKSSLPFFISSLIPPIIFYFIDSFALQNDSFELGASTFQSINPLAIFIFAPLFSVLWTWLDKIKANPSTPLKFAIGMILLSLGFIVMAIANDRAQNIEFVSPLWLFMVYLLHTLGELCLSPIGLSMVSKLSPPKIISTIMGVWMGSFALSNFLAAQMQAIAINLELPIFWFIAAETAIASIILILIAPFLKRMMQGIK